MGPTLAGFISFIQTVMGIEPLYLPVSSPVIAAAFNVAMTIVNPAISVVGSLSNSAINGVDPSGQPTLYALAVYNLAGDRLVNYAQDQPAQTYFKDLRTAMNIYGFVGGVIQSSSDEGTSQSMVVPEAMQHFTMRDLQTLKTPWGRTYMEIAQDFGYPFAMV